MSDIYTDLEAAIVETLKSDPDLAGVRTWETGIRECLFTENTLTKGFRPEELPAVNVTAQLGPAKTVSRTVGEAEVAIPVTVLVATRAQRKDQARRDVLGLMPAFERALNGCRKSDNGLGGNAIVSGELSTSTVVVEEKPLSFGIGQIELIVLKVVQL